ncbi:MAG: metal-binding protein [Sphingobacteriales bacterium]|nr:MAG: metal-binding protein [Sphingobacteriales bacterium]
MIDHVELASSAFARSRHLKEFINTGEIQLAGNSKLHIYGTLTCSSGRRMKVANRVFFRSVHEAEETGYRPCGHCMREAYKEWKAKKWRIDSSLRSQ